MNNVSDALPSSIYLMHKYWGKKPSLEIRNIIKKYSKKGDLILDPFSGYGGLGIEGVLLNRNVILNDLNPIANFISDCIIDQNTFLQDEKSIKLIYWFPKNKLIKNSRISEKEN